MYKLENHFEPTKDIFCPNLVWPLMVQGESCEMWKSEMPPVDIYYLLFIICYLLFIIYYLSFVIYYLLFVIYYLLFNQWSKAVRSGG